MLVRAIKSFLCPGTVQPVVAGEMFDLPEATVRPWIDDGRAEELHAVGGELQPVNDGVPGDGSSLLGCLNGVPARRKRETATRIS